MLNYKKPKFWVLIIAVVAIALGVRLLMKPEPLINDSINDKSLQRELWKARVKYIGDNSAVSKLIGLLTVPEGLIYDHFSLHTNAAPLVVDVAYSTSTQMLDTYIEDHRPMREVFAKQALLLLALIDNADQINISISDGIKTKGHIFDRQWADGIVGFDIRDYAVSAKELQKLINLTQINVSPSNGIIDFSELPKKYSSDQGVKDGFLVVVLGNIINDSKFLIEDFLRSIEAQKAAYLNILQYTPEGDPLFTAISYEGGNAPFIATFDYTRDRFGAEATTSMQANYLKQFDSEDSITIFLTNSEELTMEDITNDDEESSFIVWYRK